MSPNLTFYKSGIARRLITYMVIFSGVITLAMTSIQLVWDYKTDVNHIHDQMQQVENVHLETLTSSLWSSDINDLQTHLEGMLQVRDILRLELIEQDERILYVGHELATDAVTNETITREYPMIYNQRGRGIQIGTLIVTASLNGVYQRLINKVGVILISNGIKTFLVAVFMLFLFYILNTRHLIHITNFTSKLNTDNLDGQLQLERKVSENERMDELDKLVLAINNMQMNLKNSFEEIAYSEERTKLLADELQRHKSQLEEVVQQRTEKLVGANNELKEMASTFLQNAKLTALGEMATGIAHELNQPLNVIKMTHQTVIRDMEIGDFDEELLKEDITRVVKQVDKMATIIDRMRNYSRKTIGNEVQDTDVNESINDVFALIGKQLIIRDIEVKEDLEDNLPKVHIDLVSLEQVIMNLITNARHALEDCKDQDKWIKVSSHLSEDKTEVLLNIQDNAGGIPKDIQDKIFESFFTTKPLGVGTGLGLSICKKIIEKVNGRLELKVEEGVGSTFKVILPINTTEN